MMHWCIVNTYTHLYMIVTLLHILKHFVHFFFIHVGLYKVIDRLVSHYYLRHIVEPLKHDIFDIKNNTFYILTTRCYYSNIYTGALLLYNAHCTSQSIFLKEN